MALVKLWGSLSLSKIDKKLIREYTHQDGRVEKSITISVVPLQQADDKGNTHAITLYDKENRKTIYLGRMKPEEMNYGNQQRGQQAAPQSGVGGNQADDQDLPF